MNKFKILIKWCEDNLKISKENSWSEKARIYQEILQEVLCKLKEAEKDIMTKKPLLVEDGSVDTDKLEKDGFYVIVYRSGSRPPMWLEHKGGVDEYKED